MQEPDVIDVDGSEVRKFQWMLAPGQRLVLFLLEHEDRIRLNQMQLERLAARLAALASPHRFEIVALEPGSSLKVAEAIPPREPRPISPAP